MTVRKARDVVQEIDTAAAPRGAVEDGVQIVTVGDDDEEEDDVQPVNTTATPTPEPVPVTAPALVSSVEEVPAPSDGETLLRFDTNGPRTYNMGNLRFARGEIKPVEDKYVGLLLETGYFARTTLEAYRASKTQATNSAEDARWPVGRFGDKASALRYAKEIHGLDLSPEVSIRRLNEQTLNLANRMRSRRLENEVEEIA